MRYDYKYRINNKDKGDLAMELKELTSAEQVVMKCIWDYGKDMPLQQLIENLKQDYGKDYKRTTIRTFVLHLEEKGYVTTVSYTHLQKNMIPASPAPSGQM